MTHLVSYSEAVEMDRADTLSRFRNQFHVPSGEDGSPSVYLVGNSLGLQPVRTAGRIEEVLSDWKTLGVDAHFKAESPWMPYHEQLSRPMARVVGALPGEIVVMNSLTVNLHLLMASFYRPTTTRRKILIEGNAFPSDSYAVTSQVSWHGYDPQVDVLRLAPRAGEDTIRTEDIVTYIETLGPELALVLLGGVNYLTGQCLDMEAIAVACRNSGCVVGFDLAHAAGNVPLRLHDWGIDFAAWCSYKYLNAGPGGPGGVFVHERHADSHELPRLAGWWGHDKSSRFSMPDRFRPISGAEGWQLSNPSILSLAGLRSSLEVFDEAGMDDLVDRSRRLTGFMERLVNALPEGTVDILTPADRTARGAQLSLRISGGRRIFETLSDRNVICDWREPDVIRVAPVPLYNSFEDVHRFVTILSEVIHDG